VFLVPRGYHGPSVAAPGYPLYYLNVMAGPNEQRTMAIVDDPPYAWVRSSWETMQADPRVPLITAA
jgi:5-deoxy-glucuronate isomerase